MNLSCTRKPTSGRKKISEHLLPRTRAYAEIWLDQEKVATTHEEPILGQTYLPRKFKTTVVIPPQNDIDLHANDMNFVAIAENGKLVGFNLPGGRWFVHRAWQQENLRPHSKRVWLSAARAYAGRGGGCGDHAA